MAKEFDPELNIPDLTIISDSAEKSLQERYAEQTHFFKNVLEVHPASPFAILSPLEYAHAIEGSIVEQYGKRNRPSIEVSVGPPGSSKTVTEHQINSYMLNEGTGRLRGLIEKTGFELINYKFEWGEGIFTLPSHVRVDGNYRADPVLFQAKVAEYSAAAQNIYGTVAETIRYINDLPDDKKALHKISVDDPLIVGYHERKEDGTTETIGKPSGDLQLFDLIHKQGQFEGLDYDVFVRAMVANENVYEYSQNVREQIEQVNSPDTVKRLLVENGFSLDENDSEEYLNYLRTVAKPFVVKEKINIFKQNGITVELNDEETANYVSNVARASQMTLLREDIEDVMIHLADTGKISVSGATKLKEELLRRVIPKNPAVKDELLGNSMSWLMSEHLRIPEDKGIILLNGKISSMTIANPDLPLTIVRPMDIFRAKGT